MSEGRRKRRQIQQQPIWSPKDIIEILRRPEYRFGDVPGIGLLGEQLIRRPHDLYLQDVFAHVTEEQVAAAMAANDPFHGSYPPLGSLPAFGLGRAPILQTPMGEVLTEDLNSPRSILLLGPTGAGKSNWLKLFLLSIIGAPPCLAIAFDRKPGELIDCASLAIPGLPVTILTWRALKVGMLQPPRGCDPVVFANTLVHLLAREAHLFASRRLMLECLELLYRKPRQRGTWPVFTDWMNAVDQVKVSGAGRIAGYREAALMAMKQVWLECGAILNYAASDMIDRILALSGAVVIVMDGSASIPL